MKAFVIVVHGGIVERVVSEDNEDFMFVVKHRSDEVGMATLSHAPIDIDRWAVATAVNALMAPRKVSE